MAAAQSKPPQRKQLEHSRSRRFFGFPVGQSSALIASCFGLLLLCSLVFLDLEFLFRKTAGLDAPQPADDDSVLNTTVSRLNRIINIDTHPALNGNVDPNSEPITDPTVDTSTDTVVDASTGTDTVVDTSIDAVVDASTDTVDDTSVVLDTNTDTIVDPSADTVLDTSAETVVDTVVDRDVDTKMDRKLDRKEEGVAEEKDVEVPVAEEEVVMISEGEDDSAEEISMADEKIMMKAAKRDLRGCDITQGRWVFDNVSYPLYRTRNCPFADPGFRCEDNGRPDKEFMSYHWQPHACDLPRFNASDVLERLRGQRMVFVGDSLGRNNWESMLCMLAEGVQDKSRIYEVNGESISKHSGKLIYRFKDYNCTVEYYRDPFLVPQTRPPKNAPANVTYVLKLDHVSWSVDKWIDAEIIIFNVGHWWSEHKIFRQGCRFEEDGKVQDYDLLTGMAKAMQTWATYLEKHLDPKKTEVFWLSYPTVHFRGGTWNRGGHCHQERRPLTEEEARNEWQTPWMNGIVQETLMPNLKRTLGSVTYLDITTATNYRPDGHGALYTWDTKKFGLKPRNRQDCSHFCLPGVPDAWNELILASLFAKGKHTWAL